MAYKWENGRLVPYNESEDLLDSLLDRRERLQQATKSENRSLFDKTVGTVMSIPGLKETLDVLSRPSYAVNEAFASVMDPEKRSGVGGSTVDALVGAGRGLWGTKKTSNVETLRDAGKEGALYTALGIAGDIALDPLTYFGAAPLKAAGQTAKATAGTKALAETTEQLRHVDDVKKFDYATEPADRVQALLRTNLDRMNEGKRPLKGNDLTKKVNERLTREAEERALKQINDDILKPYGLAKRSKTPKSDARKRVLEVERARKRFNMPPLTSRERNALVNKFASEEAFSIAKAAQKAAEGTVEAERAGLKLRFGPFSTEVRADSPGISRVVDNPRARNTASRIVNSSLVQDLNKKFRTEGTYGREFNETRKIKSSQGVASYDEIKTAKIAAANGLSIDDVVRGLTKDESKRLYRAYELGDFTQIEDVFKSGLNKADVVKLIKYHMDDFFDTELDAGVIPFLRDEAGDVITDPATGRPLPAVEKVDNYLHHRVTKNYKEAEKLKRKHYVRAVGKDIHAPAAKRVFDTAEDAKRFGIEIDDDIRSALLNRTAKHTQSLARRSFVLDAVDNFGITIKDSKTLKMMHADGHDLVKVKNVLSDTKKGAPLDYLDDSVYVPRDVADKLKGIESVANNPGPFLNLLDGFMRRWKPAVTVYNPGHHVRNFYGDVFLGFLDGVKNPKYYHQAAEIVIDKKVGGHLALGAGKLRKDQVIKLYHETGASPTFIQTEVANETVGRIGQGVRDLSHGREEIGRMAHFLHAMKEEMAGINHGGVVTQEVIDAAARSSQRVKKWHLDYSDLTDFEKAVMKRTIPFYTWMRKSTPLMIEAMVLRPGKVLNFDRGFNGLFETLGMEPEEALPKDMIPEWIRDSVYGQIGTSARGNPLFMTPAMPYQEPFAWTDGGFSGGLRHGLSALNPVVKTPIELGLGQSTFTGAPLQEGVGQYATGLIPAGRQISNLLSSADPEHDKGKMPLFNWLTGAGVQEITPVSQRGEVRRQIDMLEGKLAAQGKELPPKSQTSAPSSVFRWENGKLVKSSR